MVNYKENKNIDGSNKTISVGIAFATDKKNMIPKEELYIKTLDKLRNLVRKELEK